MASTPRVLIKGGATDLISVSLPGYDVTALAASDIDKLQFDSRWAGLQIFMQGTLTATGAAGGVEGIASASFGTTLSEVPLLMGWVQQSPNAYGWTPAVLRGNSADYWWAAEVSFTGVTFRSQAFLTTLTYHYSVFKRPSG